MSLINIIFVKFISLFQSLTEICNLVKTKLTFFLVHTKLIESVLFQTHLILDTFKTISDRVNVFLMSIKDILDKEKILIAQALSNNNILEIIFENVDWMNICRIFIDYLKHYNCILSKFFGIFDMLQNVLEDFGFLLNNCYIFLNNVRDVINVVFVWVQ